MYYCPRLKIRTYILDKLTYSFPFCCLEEAAATLAVYPQYLTLFTNAVFDHHLLCYFCAEYLDSASFYANETPKLQPRGQ